MAVPDNVLKPTQAEDKVLIVTECAAFPLRLIDGLQQLRDHYDYQRKHSGSAWLHNDRRDIFTDIDPPPVEVMQDLQDIFYPCLAFELIRQNQETQQLELQFYDELRGVDIPASLNPAWKQALQELVNNYNMTAALRILLDEAITELENQPAKWQSYYLPKLRKFVEQVDNLTDDNINYPYRLRVVGSRGTDDSSAKEGVINRFLTKMQERVKLPEQNKVLPASTASQKVITGVLVNDDATDFGDNRTRRRVELERLKQDADDGIITQEEYEYERQEILNKYPLRR